MTLPSLGAPARRESTRTRWVGKSAVLAQFPTVPNYYRYAALTVSMLGLQLVWSCEMSQASPYLLSLGLSKSMMAVVFVAGPLSGLIVQPLVGVLSDNCTSRLGRRRPFIIGGCVLTSIGVLLLGWAKESAGVFTPSGGTAHARLTMALAILSVYIIDFSVNVIQAMDRALLVDVIPPSLQSAANAWAGRMFGGGAVLGYMIGGLDLVAFTGGWLGGEQLKVVTLITAFFLCVCHAVTVLCVTERVLISKEDDNPLYSREGKVSSTMKASREIWSTFRTLPRPIQQVLNVQFASWVGWFPILFFSTTWVAEIYVKEIPGSSYDFASAPTTVRDLATRAGSRAMLFHSIVSFGTSIVLPLLIMSSTSPIANEADHQTARWGVFGDTLGKFAPRFPSNWLSLPLVWTMSNALFSVLLLSTWFANSVAGASLIITAAGMCWAVTNWAPFSILGELILRNGSPSPVPSSHLESHHLLPLRGVDPSSSTSPAEVDSLLNNRHHSHSKLNLHSDSSPRNSVSKFATSSSHDRSPSDSSEPARVRPRTPLNPRRSSSHPYSGSQSNSNPQISASGGSGDFPPNHQQTNYQSDPFGSTTSLQPYDHDPYSSSHTSLHSELQGATVLQIRHSDEFEDEVERRTPSSGGSGESCPEGVERVGKERQRSMEEDGEDAEWGNLNDLEADAEEEGDLSGGDQAGAILGCHNIYLVLPQFLVTALSSIIFAVFAPHHSAIPHVAVAVSSSDIVTSTNITEAIGDLARLVIRQEVDSADGQGWDALGMIFRIAGVSVAVSTWICWKMTREMAQDHTRRLRGTE